MLTEKQLEERRKGITATDVAKIAGQSPYGCGEDVRLGKLGVGRPFVEHARVRWGSILEGPIRDDYAERHGAVIVDGDSTGTLRHPTEPWAMATPDGLVYLAGRPSTIVRGWECKTHTSWLGHLYGEPGTDQVPPWELIQCAWNIWVASAFYGVAIDRWDLTVFLDGLPTDYTIIRDAELETALVSMCREFWEVHVVGGEPVPPDGSGSFAAVLGHRFPKSKPDRTIEATEAQRRQVSDLREARKVRKQWEEEEERRAQVVRLAMGDAEVLTWLETFDGKEKIQKITYRTGKDKTIVAWAGAMADVYELAESAGSLADIGPKELEELTDSHTRIAPGARPFKVPRTWPSK